ncbi:MAG: flavocytochrome c, partial [Sedimentibacter sp.]|nr:flavocytochrome c [Sedimentibacter sp.]
KAILEQNGATAFLVLDKQVYEKASTYEKYKNQGLLKEAKTLAELAEIMKVDAATLESTVAKYNEAVKAKSDAEFGRTSLEVELITAPYYTVEISPAIHHTMGGVTINTEAQVINKSGAAVEGLFAAGEVTGGVHGGNRIGGNAVTDITVFGRIAGASAAAFVGK